MVENLDLIITVLEPITLVLFLGLWIYALINLIRRRNRRKVFVTMGAAAACVLLVITLASILTARVRRDLRHFLEEKNGPFTLQVEGRPVEEARSDSLLTMLRSVRPLPAHHTHPTDRVAIQVVDAKGRVVNLAFGRDSQVPREYWVFQTDYETTSNNELGRVITPLLDGL